MESEEQWSHRDFTQIKERRPEGTEVNWELEEEASAFSFLWPARREEEEEGGKEEGDGEGEFEFSHIMATTSSMSAAERPGMSSPADELFFKGQLLPLHLPPRIQMVKKLVHERHRNMQQSVVSENVVHRKVESGGVAVSQARFARLFQPKFCSADAAAAPAARSWWDPREGAAHTVHECSCSGSTSCDSSGDSSSSRDSNGSSQDCFDGAAKLDGQFADSKGFFHNREVFSAQSAYPADQRASGISTWLRPPFKWKVLLGAKKPSSLKAHDIDVQPRALSMEAVESTTTLFPTSGADRYYSDCSGELTHSGDLLLSSRGAFVHPRGMERAKGYLMRALNLTRSKDHPPRAAITTSKTFPPFSQSFRFSPKDIPLRSVKRPPPPPSPLPPTPRVSTSSPSAELHCDIKGAIAHCKESQKQAEDT